MVTRTVIAEWPEPPGARVRVHVEVTGGAGPRGPDRTPLPDEGGPLTG